jgi:hypothetical protein
MLLLEGKLRVQATLNQAKDHASRLLQGKWWQVLAPLRSWESLLPISLAVHLLTSRTIIRPIRPSQIPRLNRLLLHRLLRLNRHQPLRPEHLTGERYVFLIVMACLWTPRVSPAPSHIKMTSLIVLSLPPGIQKPDQFWIIITRKCEGQVKRHLRLLTESQAYTFAP